MDQMDCTPQILGPALSGAFISGLGSDTECPHGKGQVKDREDWLCCHLGDHTAGLNWLSRNLIKFPKRKYIYKQMKTCEADEIQQ